MTEVEFICIALFILFAVGVVNWHAAQEQKRRDAEYRAKMKEIHEKMMGHVEKMRECADRLQKLADSMRDGVNYH